MKTIETRYIGPSNYRGARISATDCGDHHVYVPYPQELSGAEAHWPAAQKLARQLGWKGTMIAGGTKAGYVFVFAEGDAFEIGDDRRGFWEKP